MPCISFSVISFVFSGSSVVGASVVVGTSVVTGVSLISLYSPDFVSLYTGISSSSSASFSLNANASRGDQILNARSFKEHGYSMVMEEEEITPEKLLSVVNELYNNRETYIRTMEKSPQSNAVETIIELIKKTSK